MPSAEGIASSRLFWVLTIGCRHLAAAPGGAGCVNQAAAHAPPRHALPPLRDVSQVTENISAKAAAIA